MRNMTEEQFHKNLYEATSGLERATRLLEIAGGFTKPGTPLHELLAHAWVELRAGTETVALVSGTTVELPDWGDSHQVGAVA